MRSDILAQVASNAFLAWRDRIYYAACRASSELVRLTPLYTSMNSEFIFSLTTVPKDFDAEENREALEDGIFSTNFFFFVIFDISFYVECCSSESEDIHFEVVMVYRKRKIFELEREEKRD